MNPVSHCFLPSLTNKLLFSFRYLKLFTTNICKKKKKHKPLSYSGVSVSLAQNCFLSPRWVASAADNPRLFTGLLRSESILSHSSASQRTQYNSSHMAGAQKMFLDCRRSSPLNIWRCYQVSPSLLRLKILGSFLHTPVHPEQCLDHSGA